jgi:predicted NBD/HSP70 family sugar kinase
LPISRSCFKIARLFNASTPVTPDIEEGEQAMPPADSRHDSLLDVPPGIGAPLDPGFRPAVLAARSYAEALAASGRKDTLSVALERTRGAVSRRDIEIFPAGTDRDADTFRHAERIVKFLLWSQGGWKLHLSGPEELCRGIRDCYRPGGTREFDCELMARAYGRPFEAVIVDAGSMPEAQEAPASVGGHLDGCRIGFDLGASDYKIAAVQDGEALFSNEIPWNPSVEADPAYHADHIDRGLRKAAAHLPRVDAIGGSAAGIYVDNMVMVASLFRSVPAGDFESKVKPLFLNLQKKWNVPFEVCNDGDVTALAGALSLERNALLGIAMGSSEAAGFLDGGGRITGWLNELAFAPVDYAPDAARDEWSGDRGVGAMYFSQQAVGRLAPRAGFAFPEETGLPERLKAVQGKADAGDEAALAIFATIGVYLGYTIPHYAGFYDMQNLLILGRVTSGRGGEVILEKAREVLAREFPEIAAGLTLHVPDEKSRRVGQAVAAASLPETG